jgi:hypothetical protein
MCGCHKDEQMEDENGVLFAILLNLCRTGLQHTCKKMKVGLWVS